MAFMALNFADKGVLGLVADPIRDDLDLTATEFGTIASAFYLLFSLSAVLVGFLGNRMRARPLLALLVLIWSVAQLPILLPVAGFAALLGTRVLLGAGEGPSLPLANHTAFGWFPQDRRSLPAALMTVGGALGAVIGAPLVLVVNGVLGWRGSFGVLGVLGLLWLLAWWRWGGDGPYSSATAAETDKSRESEKAEDAEPDVRLPYRRVFLTGTWLGGTFSMFTVMWSLALALTWLPTWLEDHVHFSDAEVSGAIGLPSVMGVVLALSAGVLAQRLLKRGASPRLAQGVVGAIAALAAGVCLLGLTRVSPVALMLPLMAIGFAAGNAQTPLTNAAIARICPPGQRAAALATSYAIAATSSILAPYVSGRLIDSAASEAAGFDHAFDLSGWLLLAGGLIAFLTVRPDRDAQATAPEDRSPSIVPAS
ncbi:MFS transporter [Actinomadura rudentiformis]|uniref:MFS transporter n=2 Tax=Actinomadura rudentiformis TaxID=359158 RepID=A0A6H9Z007_9ACTN|nr:MFS transporter [Actinomadura rudentiformis]